MYFCRFLSVICIDELNKNSFVQGKSARKAETQSHKATTLHIALRVTLVGPPKARRPGDQLYRRSGHTLLSDEFLLTKAKPPKGGDAKLRD